MIGVLRVVAYGASTLSIASFPATSSVTTADCAALSYVLDQSEASGQIGWVSFGEATKGGDSDGCNTALEPCGDAVTVKTTSWGSLKKRYR